MNPGIRVKAVTAGLWILVVTGPVLGLVALSRSPATDPQPATPAVPVGITGLAELAVVAHLTAVPGGISAAVSPAHPALRVGTAVLDDLTTADREAAIKAVDVPIHAAGTVSVEPAGPGRWGVTVVVLRGERVESWQVTVAAGPTGPLVETVPALVALPQRRPVPVPALSPLRPPDPQDPVTGTVERFLDAFLTDDGEFGRYLAPDARLDDPPVPLEHSDLRRIASGPVDDRHLAVLAEVRANRPDGAVHLMHYPLLLRRAADRWEVQRLLPALPLRSPDPDPDQ